MGLGSSSVTTGFGALATSCDSRVQVDFRSELGNQKFSIDGQGSCAAGDAGGLNFFRSTVTFPRGWRPAFALRRPLEFPTVPSEGDFHVGREFLLLTFFREVRRGQRRRPRYRD